MDKKAGVHIHNGVLAVKKNIFELVLMRWKKMFSVEERFLAN